MEKAAPEEGRGRLARLMAARLATSVAVLGLALVFVGPGEEAQEAARGLYGSIAAAFLCTAIFAAVLPWVRKIEPYAVLQIAVDLALVTSAVLFTGGGRSIFSFLYLPIVVLGAILFDRRGGYGAAVAASIGFAGVVTFGQGGSGAVIDSADVKFAIWGMHTGGLVLVAMLSTTLARELRTADADLEASRAALTRLEALHQRTIESVTSGLLTTGFRGRVVSCNPEGEMILGLPSDRILGRAAGELLPGVAALMDGPADPQRRERTRLRLSLPDGRVQHLGVAVSVLRSVEGKPDGHVVIFQDVTKVVELEAELQRSARLAGVGELAASIAHEIRNPLAAISGSVEMLEQNGEPEDRKRLHAIVLREIDRLDRLISDFLLYARPNPPKLETVGLAELFQEFEEVDSGSTGRLRCEAPPGLTVEADSAQLRQVLWNLIRNARDASPDGAEVCVSARALDPQETGKPGRNTSEEGRGVEITVSDAGEGIGPEALDRIFDPFFTTKEEGTGLGLATVHRILDAHEAAVHVESRPGVGTTFHLSFGCEAREIS